MVLSSIVSNIASIYVLTWQVCRASWNQDWTTQQKLMGQIGSKFETTTTSASSSVVSTLLWNVIVFTSLQTALIYSVDDGWSLQHRRFCVGGATLPALLISLVFYGYKYGVQECYQALSLASFQKWVINWITLHGITLCCLTQIAMVYLLGVVLQPYVLPTSWQFSVRFPATMYEDYMRAVVYFHATLFGLCMITLPLSKRGYELSMEVAGRNNVKITYPELILELLYQTSHSTQSLFTYLPIMILLQTKLGFRIYTIHFLFLAVELVLINYAFQYKFCIFHQLFHEIKPLYHMCHLEHHICKSTFPTTPGVALWETWFMGQSPFFSGMIGGVLPWFFLQTYYTGTNIVVHTMWPSARLLQWHCLHHTILSDVYMSNIPSPYDKQHSKSVSKLQTKLESVSPFIKYEFLSDLVGFAFMGIAFVVFHFVLGIGASHEDWSKADVLYTAIKEETKLLWSS